MWSGIHMIQTQQYHISPVCAAFLPVRLSLPCCCPCSASGPVLAPADRLSPPPVAVAVFTIPTPQPWLWQPSSQSSASSWEEDQNSRKGLRLITTLGAPHSSGMSALTAALGPYTLFDRCLAGEFRRWLWRDRKILSVVSLESFPNSSEILSFSHSRSESMNKVGGEGERSHSRALGGLGPGVPKYVCSWRTGLREPRPKACRSHRLH